jgi:hypothetical protein
MNDYKTIFFVMCLLFSLNANAQKPWKIYLGPSEDSFFAYPASSPDVSASDPLIVFAGYRTFSHCTIDSGEEDTENRVGLVLPAKSTSILNKEAEAFFGTGNDTCFVHYKSTTIKITHGKSALISVGNIFFGGTQPDPYDVVAHLWLNGQIFMNDTSSEFSVDYTDETLFLPKGWLILHGDTLHFEPASYLIKNGKPHKAVPVLHTGVLLKKGDTIYAGLDEFEKEPRYVSTKETMYVSTKLSYEDRMMILTCFFVLACYV